MVLGPRYLIEAVFIVAVAVIAGVAHAGTWTVLGGVAGACLIVATVELVRWMRNTKGRGLPPAGSDPGSPATPEQEAVTLRPDPPPVPASPLIAVAPPPPTPTPEPEPEPQPTLAYLPPADIAPREWNLWDLERLARSNATGDAARNEERAYLLMYLREFAGPDGLLPADFDGLVRDAFGDLLRVAAT